MFYDHLEALKPSEKWAINYIDIPSNTDAIAQAISSFQCYAVSDASLDEICCGTAAFTLVGPSDENAIRAVHKVPGPIKPGNSYRCELSGIFGIIILTRLIMCQHHITEGSVHVRCDNESCIRIFNYWFVPDPSEDSFDLVHAVWHMIRESPLKWTAEWVEGHQDDLGLELDRFALLNCAMDKLANTYRMKILQSDPAYVAPQIDIAMEGWNIWCGNEKLHSPHKTVLYDRIYKPQVLEY